MIRYGCANRVKEARPFQQTANGFQYAIKARETKPYAMPKKNLPAQTAFFRIYSFPPQDERHFEKGNPNV
jgi:hypothetical protein